MNIKLLEEVQEEEATTKEQYYYDLLKPLYNIYRPGQTMKEYRQTAVCQQKEKERYASETRKEQQKEYGKSEAGKRKSARYRLKKKLEKEISTTN
jgi:hypothetical protein